VFSLFFKSIQVRFTDLVIKVTISLEIFDVFQATQGQRLSGLGFKPQPSDSQPNAMITSIASIVQSAIYNINWQDWLKVLLPSLYLDAKFVVR